MNTMTWQVVLNWVYTYLIFVIFFTRTKFLENKIYTEKTRKLRQNTQKIANFLRYYGKIHSKLPIFRVKSVKIYTGQKKFTWIYSWRSWQISGVMMTNNDDDNCVGVDAVVDVVWHGGVEEEAVSGNT